MPGDPMELIQQARYERNGWPAQKRPELDPPSGWSLELLAGIARPRAHTGDSVMLTFEASDVVVLPRE